MENNDNNNNDLKSSYKLTELIDSDKTGIELPAVQRGLVWSPNQAEFLWDSILRGFPIGSFVVAKTQGGNKYLMDGQQRLDAIKKAYEPPNKNSDTIFWIDLDPDQESISNSTRKFCIMVITKTHPWGFNLDKESSTLTARERRDAIGCFWPGEEKDIYKNKIELNNCFPFKAKFPVPLSWLLNADTSTENKFEESVLTHIVGTETAMPWKDRFWRLERTEMYAKFHTKIIAFHKTFKKLSDYSIPISKFDMPNMDSENEESELEILFTRLGTGGTEISQDDLFYSAIKAYWEEDVKREIEYVAGENKLPRAKLSLLLFRLYLMRKERSFVNELSISKIRELAKNENENTQIRNFIQSQTDGLVKTIEDSFAAAEVPSFIRMKIISEKTDIYLLLLYLACLNSEINFATLALFLYWFSKDARNARDCIGIILDELFKSEKRNGSSNDIKQTIKKGISRANCKKTLYCVKTPEDLKAVEQSLTDENRSILEIAGLNDYAKYDWLSFWQVIAEDSTKTFLLYAQKEYINKTFTQYNPADSRNWESHDRPWDYDHIIPKDWIASRRGGIRKKVKYWIGRVGNFAAIPFSENRSKGNVPNFEYYEDNSEELLFEKKFKDVKKASLLDEDCVSANDFAKIVFERTIKIYEKCYKTIEKWIPSASNLDQDMEERKEFVKQVQEQVRDQYGLKSLPEPKIYVFDYIAEWDRVYDESSTENRSGWIAWSSSYLTVGIPDKNDAFVVGFTWGLEGDGRYEIGLRKRNLVQNKRHEFKTAVKKFRDNTEGFDEEENEWWYLLKEYTEKPSLEQVLTDLRELLKDFRSCIM